MLLLMMIISIIFLHNIMICLTFPPTKWPHLTTWFSNVSPILILNRKNLQLESRRTSPVEKEAAIFQDTKSFAILTWPWCRSRPLTDRSPELIVNKEVEEMYFKLQGLTCTCRCMLSEHAHVILACVVLVPLSEGKSVNGKFTSNDTCQAALELCKMVLKTFFKVKHAFQKLTSSSLGNQTVFLRSLRTHQITKVSERIWDEKGHVPSCLCFFNSELNKRQ